jgi:hypothetical protein
MSIPTTRERVPAHTADHINRQIEQTIEDNVGQHGVTPETIARRLSQLDAEWDIERAIEANASALAFIGLALGYFVHPYWLAFPALVTAFLFQHAVQGWCPPIPVLRRLRFRTVHEIEQERQALKAIRGDYQDLKGARDRVSTVLAAVKR